MDLGVSTMFFVLWVVLGFIVLTWLARLVFHERFRAELAAAAVVLAFAAGAIWPFSERRAASTEVATAPAAAPPAAVHMVPGRDVSLGCRTATLRSPKGHGSVDVVGVRANGEVVPVAAGGSVAPADVLVVKGWVANRALSGPAAGVCLVVDGALIRQASSVYGATRPDVGAAFHRDALNDTGFVVSLPASQLTAGVHTISAAAVAADGSASLVDGGATISRR
jgi:hypothetical protein